MNEQKKNAPARPAATAAARPQNAAARGDFVRGVIAEMRRVTWPTRDEWVSATVLTIVLVVGIGFLTFALDWIFGSLFNLVHPLQGV